MEQENWRNELYNSIEKEQTSLSLDTPKKVLEFFKTEFEELIKPIQVKYKGYASCNTITTDCVYCYIGTHRLTIDSSYHHNGPDRTITVYRNIKLENGEDGHEKIAAITTNGKAMGTIIGSNENEYVDEDFADRIFEMGFGSRDRIE